MSNDLIEEYARDLSDRPGAELRSEFTPASDPVVERFGRALLSAEEFGGSFGQLYVDSISTAIVARLLVSTGQAGASERSKVAGLAKWRLKRAIDYIEARLAESVSIADVASATGLTRVYFSAQFKASTGLWPHEYLLRRRIERAHPITLGADKAYGLLLPGARKSVEPIAAVTALVRVAAQHQSLLHFVGNAPWSDERVLARVRELVLPSIEREGPIEAWIIDDTGFPKKGRHSVGVTRQYCGQLGKQDNCQVAVTMSVANHAASLPIAYRLYLPEDWAADTDRRAKAGVPTAVAFQTKPEIALDQIRAALEAEVPKGVVLMDAGCGADTALRTEITSLGLAYVAGIQPHTSIWAPGTGPLPPKPWSGRGRPASQRRRDAEHRPIQAKALALSLPASAWETITWREGSADWLVSRYARVRVRAAHRDEKLPQPRPEEWLLVEWPEGEAEPTKYWLRPCRPISPSPNWSISPSCAGGSSATIKSSNRNSASATMKGAAGAASIITPHCASPPTDS